MIENPEKSVIYGVQLTKIKNLGCQTLASLCPEN